MVPRLSERQQAIVFAAILIAAIAGLYATTQLMQPVRVRAAAVHLVRLDVDGAGWPIEYAPLTTTNNTPFGLLLEASANMGFPLAYVWYQIPQGVFVTAINGSVNGEGGRYWQYWVSGAYGDVAADVKALHDNDTVLWKFVSSVEGG